MTPDEYGMVCLRAAKRVPPQGGRPLKNGMNRWRWIPLFLLAPLAIAAPAPGTYWTYQVEVREVQPTLIYQYTTILTVVVLESAVPEQGSGLAVPVLVYGMIADAPRAATGHILYVFGPSPVRWPFLTLAVPGTYAGGYVQRAMSGLLSPPLSDALLEGPCTVGWVERPGWGILREQVCLEEKGEDTVFLPEGPVRAVVLEFSATVPEEDHDGNAWWVSDLSGWVRATGRVRRATGFCFYEILLVDRGYLTAAERAAFWDRLSVLLGRQKAPGDGR